MSARVYLLIISVFVLSSMAGAESINVTNHSFELDVNGVQIDWKGPMDNVLAWEGCCGDADTGVNGTLAKYPGSDGQTYAWGHNFTGGGGFFQVLDHNIVGGKHYTVIYDAKNLWQSEPNHLVSFFYPDGDGEANHVELGSQWYLVTTINDDTWYELDIEMLWTALPDMPYVGKPLGIKFYFPDQGSTIYTGIDNVRLTSIDASTAWKPQPENEQKEVVKNVTLSWNPGMWAAGHEVYFGTNFTEVDEADRFDLTGIYRGSDDVTGPDPNGRYSYTPDEIPLAVGTIYYWRVDEVNETYTGPNPPPDGRWKGDVWSFYTTGFALNPNPADGALDVPLTAVLTWTAGTDAEAHDVYFGTDYSNVADANTSSSEYRPPRLNFGNESYDAGANENLKLGKEYYWRIDEITDGGTRTIKGDVWTFTVAEFLIIDDMESYVNYTNDIFNTWVDYMVNDSTAEILLETGDANYIQDDQAMKYAFENSDSPYYAETSREFSPAQDWTISGFKALVLDFRGDFLNDQSSIQPMSVSLTDGTDTGTVEYDDPNDLAKGWMGWQEWAMALQDFADQGVDLNNITGMSIIIGDGTPAGDGSVYIDNIRLHTTRCVIDKAVGSFTYDCDVNFDDLAALARDWLLSGMGTVSASEPNDTGLIGHWTMDDNISFGTEKSVVLDSSGNDNHGLIYDDVDAEDAPKLGATASHSVTGYIDRALEFDGFDDFVEIQPLNLNTNTATISAWVKRYGQQSLFAGIVHTYLDAVPGTSAGIDLGSGGSEGFMQWSSWEVNHELAYFWGVDSEQVEWTWDWHTGMIVPDQMWAFVALVVEPDKATVYLHDGLSLRAATHRAIHHAELFNGPTRIADQMQFPYRLFKGAIDDVRIYNRSLSTEEIVYLAQGASTSADFILEPWRANANPTGPGHDDIVNGIDYAVMADNWLTKVLWP